MFSHDGKESMGPQEGQVWHRSPQSKTELGRIRVPGYRMPLNDRACLGRVWIDFPSEITTPEAEEMAHQSLGWVWSTARTVSVER